MDRDPGQSPEFDAPFLSVVVPMYREAMRIGPTIADASAWLRGWDRPSELILVDDGSDDATFDTAGASADIATGGRLASARVLRHERNLGKGAAVRTGMMASRGRWVLFMDADNSTRVSEVERLFGAIRRGGAAAGAPGGVDVAIGSREAQDSDVRKTPMRSLSGAFFRGALRFMGMSLALDTQCGFKLYSADAASHILRHSTEDRFAFDVEHLAIARRDGIGVTEVGVRWTHAPGGTVSVASDGLKMLRAVRAIRKRLAGTVPDPFTQTFPIEHLAGCVPEAQVEAKPAAGVGAGL